MQVSMRASWGVVFSLCVLSRAVAAQAEPVRIYVDASAPGGGSGRAWSCAYSSLDLALAHAPWGAHLWVAAGTYRPVTRIDPSDPRSATFSVRRNHKLFGGFAGDEITFEERAGLFDATILDGDLGVEGDDADNADHVVRVSGPATSQPGAMVIDGFTIQNGNARDSGGGIFDVPVPVGQSLWQAGNLQLRNCTLRKNKAAQFGGALHSMLARVDIAWCTFTENEANAGGALHPMSSPLYVFNSRFVENRGLSRGGAFSAETAIYDPDTGPTIWFVNSLFERNSAPHAGAAFVASSQYASASAAFFNCTFTRNEATVRGGALEVKRSPSLLAQPHVFVFNSISWGNTAPSAPDLLVIDPQNGAPPFFAEVVVDQSIVGGGWPGNNSSADPRLFADGRLAPNSPAIDAGNNLYLLPDLIDLDQDDELEVWPLALGSVVPEARLRKHPHASPALPGVDPYGFGMLVDIGAHEFQPQLVPKH
ncbi:MAG: hypothetical protein ACKVWV_20175 [Planctomycetota bacterium]